MPTWLAVLLALLPSSLTFGVGLIIGYGRATARVAVLETQVRALIDQVGRLENVLMYGHPEGGRRRADVR